jgi:hypothetical protein
VVACGSKGLLSWVGYDERTVVIVDRRVQRYE